MTATTVGLVVDGELDEGDAVYGAMQNSLEIYEDDVIRIAIIGLRLTSIDRDVVDPIPVHHSSSRSIPGVVNFFLYQLQLARTLREERERLDLVSFHIGGSVPLLPISANRLSGIRSLLFIIASTEKWIRVNRDRGSVSKAAATAIDTVEKIVYALPGLERDDLKSTNGNAREYPSYPTVCERYQDILLENETVEP